MIKGPETFREYWLFGNDAMSDDDFTFLVVAALHIDKLAKA